MNKKKSKHIYSAGNMLTIWFIVCQVFIIYLLVHLPHDRKGLPFAVLRQPLVLGTCEVTGMWRLWTLASIVQIQQAVLFLWSVTLAARTIIQQLWLNSRGSWTCLPSGCCKMTIIHDSRKDKVKPFLLWIVNECYAKSRLTWNPYELSSGDFPAPH
jgi:hypothetical protein